ncbi:RNHCP domain-containing protein [Candidatus Kaiserbacteria bacterium]|nr:RNHCP domain-containing protein [Candidatus Kaiserbacteria bacterium]
MFKRTKEDFKCEHCGEQVVGNGYTNHCPGCLWSKHVDIEPGDRASECGGMMRPVLLEEKNGGYVVLHRCTECSFEKHNKLQNEDNFDPEQVLNS